MEKIEENYLSPEERWQEAIPKRAGLWNALIKDSRIEEELREKFINVITIAKNRKFSDYYSLEDWIYGTLSGLLNIAEEAVKNGKTLEEAKILFEELRHDIWDFYRELIK